jgi:hypothetical protein
LRRIVEDDLLRVRLGAAARQRALTRPTWDEAAKMFFDHLRAVTDT